MTTITAEQLGADDFEPGDSRLPNLIESFQAGLEQVKALPEIALSKAVRARELGKAAILGVSDIPELFRQSYWRPADAKNSEDSQY